MRLLRSHIVAAVVALAAVSGLSACNSSSSSTATTVASVTTGAPATAPATTKAGGTATTAPATTKAGGSAAGPTEAEIKAALVKNYQGQGKSPAEADKFASCMAPKIKNGMSVNSQKAVVAQNPTAVDEADKPKFAEYGLACSKP